MKLYSEPPEDLFISKGLRNTILNGTAALFLLAMTYGGCLAIRTYSRYQKEKAGSDVQDVRDYNETSDEKILRFRRSSRHLE